MMRSSARRAWLWRSTLVVCLLEGAAWGAPPRRPKRPRPPPSPPTAPAVPAASAAAPGSGSNISVSVIEVAGELAYVQPGASGGVNRGSRVVIRGHEYRVLAATAAYATINATEQPLREQEKGIASSATEQTDRTAPLPPPHPLSAFAGVWPEPEAPATKQTVVPVPLGDTNRSRRWDVRLSSTAGIMLPMSDDTLTRSRGRAVGLGRAELQARVHAEPIQAPLAIDFDVALQGWFGPGLDQRLGDESRPTLRVRELQVGYGQARGWYGALGRMRYAAATLGALDGARASAPLGTKVTVGAFGGVVPNPLSDGFSTAAQRFGVETTYVDTEVAWRPAAALVVQGSTFDGKLDERRVMGTVGIYPGRSRFGGHFEVSGFDKSNPWRAAPIELTAAGIDGSVRAGVFQLGARFDVRQQDRSRWLASFLPASWFCNLTPQTPTTPPVAETCADSGAPRYLGAVDASVELGSVSFMSGATILRDPAGPSQLGGFLHSRVLHIFRNGRFDASGSVSSGTFMDLYGGSLGPGASLFHDTFDVSVYYRLAMLQYRAVNQTLAQHAVGSTLMLFPSSDLLFTLQGEGMRGTDVDALVVYLTALWRPRL